jgi:protease I
MVLASNESLLRGINFAALAMDGFEAKELLDPWHALEEAGAILRVVSAEHGTLQGVERDQPGDAVDVHLRFEEADPQEFAAVLIPGGARHAEQLRRHAGAQQFIQGFVRDGKPVAAIGHGVALLADAGVIKGQTLTGAADLQDDIVRAGGNWIDKDVMCEGWLVTSRMPEDLPAFINATVALTAGHVKESIHGTRDEKAAIGPSS